MNALLFIADKGQPREQCSLQAVNNTPLYNSLVFPEILIFANHITRLTEWRIASGTVGMLKFTGMGSAEGREGGGTGCVGIKKTTITSSKNEKKY